MKAKSTLMHRSENIIALRADQGTGTVVQIFNLEKKERVKQIEIKEVVVYWRWIDNNTLSIVGKSAVFHVSIVNQAAPTKVFD